MAFDTGLFSFMSRIVTDSYGKAITHSCFLLRDDSPMKHPEFAKRFKMLCDQAGLPSGQEAAGKILGVSGPYIWKCRNGESIPGMDTAIRWAQILNCCVEYLLTGRGPVRPLEADSSRVTVDITDLPEAQQEAVKTTVQAFKGTPDTPASSA